MKFFATLALILVATTQAVHIQQQIQEEAPSVDQFITALDSDKNGKISKKELLTAVNKAVDASGCGTQCASLKKQYKDAVDQVWSLLDKDGDDELSKKEIVAAMKKGMSLS